MPTDVPDLLDQLDPRPVMLDLLRYSTPEIEARARLLAQRPVDQCHKEWRQIILDLMDAKANSPEEIAKRHAEQARVERGEYKLIPCPDGGMMTTILDSDHMLQVLGLQEVDDGSDGAPFLPTPEEAEAAYQARMADPSANHLLVQRAYTAYRKLLGR